MSIYGQRRLRSNPADVCKSLRKVRNVTRRIFCRLFPAGHETTACVTLNKAHTECTSLVCTFHCYSCSLPRAVNKVFSLGVLTFTTHYKQLCAICSILQI